MTCAENRELHSALLDGELTAAERTTVEGHLAGCAECSAELERLARMLGVLHALPDARASIGFVDRVLAATRPVPWYRRLSRRLLEPWQVKLPLEAAAVAIVALGAVYVFQKTPELQQATRYEAPAPRSAPAPETVSPPATPAPPVVSAPAPESPAAPPPASAPTLSARTAETPLARPAEQEAQKSQQEESGKREALMKERDAGRSRDATAPPAPGASPAEDSPPTTAAPKAVEPAREKKGLERRERPAARVDGAKQDAASQNVQPGPADPRLGAAAPASPA
ncbi:MAG TPA: zf-HC2 domain-containing protein, partial [Methylomirabilota bacterium]|nr:zf-HC2 domain-containing protein [Methylomirabilota bacterium]